ncbi:hypothetical protein TPAR_03719, partial [Tolypocladium paradoxum]
QQHRHRQLGAVLVLEPPRLGRLVQQLAVREAAAAAAAAVAARAHRHHQARVQQLRARRRPPPPRPALRVRVVGPQLRLAPRRRQDARHRVVPPRPRRRGRARRAHRARGAQPEPGRGRGARRGLDPAVLHVDQRQLRRRGRDGRGRRHCCHGPHGPRRRLHQGALADQEAGPALSDPAPHRRQRRQRPSVQDRRPRLLLPTALQPALPQPAAARTNSCSILTSTDNIKLSMTTESIFGRLLG